VTVPIIAVLILSHAFSWSPAALVLHIAKPNVLASALCVGVYSIPYMLLYRFMFRPLCKREDGKETHTEGS